MFDPKSNFVLNKLERNAIVCKRTTGIHIRLTCEDVHSEKEFIYWKELSDDDNKVTASTGRGYYDSRKLAYKPVANSFSSVTCTYHQEQNKEFVQFAELHQKRKNPFLIGKGFSGLPVILPDMEPVAGGACG